MRVLLGVELGAATGQLVVSALREVGVQVVDRSADHIVEELKHQCFSNKHLDALILLAATGSERIPVLLHLVREIRELNAYISIQGSVKACTIPILILLPAKGSIERPTLRLSAYRDVTGHPYLDPEEPSVIGDSLITSQAKWCRVFHWDSNQDATVWVFEALEGLVADWMGDLIKDLDQVGYAVTECNGQLKVSQALVRRRGSGQILSDAASPGRLRASEFVLFERDLCDASNAVQFLEVLLNNYEEIAKLENGQPETVLQRFFELHPHLLMMDGYDTAWPKPRLKMDQDGSHYEPDFVLTASAAPSARVLDLKLPSAPVLVRRRHRGFSAQLNSAIDQMHDYRKHFNCTEFRDRLDHMFGAPTCDPELAIVIGRKLPDEDQRILAERQEERGCRVQILFYDTVIEYEQQRLGLKLQLVQRASSKL